MAHENLLLLQSFFNVSVNDIHNNEFILFNLLTQKDLGDLIGASRQSIAKALKSLKR